MEPKKEKEGCASRLGTLLRGKGRVLILLVLALGVLLLLFGGQETGTGEGDYARHREEYRRETEERVAKLCALVRGVGRVSVLITLEAGEEYVYAKDESNGGTDYVTGQSGGLLLTRRAPRVAGVAVVCDGGDSEAVKNELTTMLHALLDVPYGHISISPAKSAQGE